MDILIIFVRIRPLGFFQLEVINFDYVTNILSVPLCIYVGFGEPVARAHVRACVRAYVKYTTQLNINFKKAGTKTKNEICAETNFTTE
jgi:hypothetical protein